MPGRRRRSNRTRDLMTPVHEKIKDRVVGPAADRIYIECLASRPRNADWKTTDQVNDRINGAWGLVHDQIIIPI